MNERNVVYIGRKSVMNHVPAVLTCFNQKVFEDVVLRARGRTIGVAVDTAEVTKRSFKRELTTGVSIGTEQGPKVEGGARNVSCMGIIPRKPTTIENKPATMDDNVAEENEVRTLLEK